MNCAWYLPVSVGLACRWGPRRAQNHWIASQLQGVADALATFRHSSDDRLKLLQKMSRAKRLSLVQRWQSGRKSAELVAKHEAIQRLALQRRRASRLQRWRSRREDAEAMARRDAQRQLAVASQQDSVARDWERRMNRALVAARRDGDQRFANHLRRSSRLQRW